MLSGRIKELDSLRGLAALWVVFVHYGNFCTLIRGSPVFPVRLEASASVLFFFMISGFVILMTLHQKPSTWHFAVARFARLAPTFLVAVPITFIAVRCLNLQTAPHGVWTALANLTLFHHWFGVPDLDEVYWTLRHEVCFYALMGLFLWLGALRRIGTLCWTWLGISTALIVANRFGLPRPPEAISTVLQTLYICFFIAGMGFYQLRLARGSGNFRKQLKLHALVVGTYVNFLLQHPGYMMGGGMILAYVTFYLLIHDRLRFLCLRPLLFLGGISYPLYLLHQDVGLGLIQKLEVLGVPCRPGAVIAGVVAISLATVVSYSVERPAMRFVKNLLASSPLLPAATPGQTVEIEIFPIARRRPTQTRQDAPTPAKITS